MAKGKAKTTAIKLLSKYFVEEKLIISYSSKYYIVNQSHSIYDQ